jgi:hypothetical protein
MAAKVGAHTSWAHTENRPARTLPARMALEAKFLREADPDNKMPPAARTKAAESLRKAFYVRMSLKSAQVRRRRAMGVASRMSALAPLRSAETRSPAPVIDGRGAASA